MTIEIGKKIKKLRNDKNLTLKELSERTQLSTGFISQLERGLTTIDTDSLERVAKALDVNLSSFFVKRQKKKECVMRSYEREVSQIDSNKFIHFHLSNNLENKEMIPRIIDVLPKVEDEEIQEFQHKGEEFIHVLEGILTVYLNHMRYELHPGDSMHIKSDNIHNWDNYTNKVTRILIINIPNSFKENEK